MTEINKDKLFDYMDEKILDLHPFPKESSNYVEKCVLQDLKRSINSGKFDSENVDSSSLITTIESQREEIRRRVIQAEINISLGETVINMQAEIESLKAITELAVKGLKKELDVAKLWDREGSIAHIESILGKIERLQNG